MRAQRPERSRGLNTEKVSKIQVCERGPEGSIDAITGIGQDHTWRDTRCESQTDLVERDLGLGLELDLLGHASRRTALQILSPQLRKIEPVGDGKARMQARHRQRDGNLAVILFANLATVLACDPDRVPALLGKTCIINHPGQDPPMPLDLGQDLGSHERQESLVGPVCLSDEMVERLMGRLNPSGFEPGCHRFDALALARQDQPGAVGLQRRRTISMTQSPRQGLNIGCKAPLARLHTALAIHLSLLFEIESPNLHLPQTS